jgi:hypothetical protein
MEGKYQTAFGRAQSAWDSTSAPGYLDEQSTSLDPEVNVIDGSYADSWWALNSYSCESSGLYSGNETTVDFNARTMVGLSADESMIVAEHELGHSYGLDHQTTGCYLMRQGEIKFTCGSMPTSSDVSGARTVAA